MDLELIQVPYMMGDPGHGAGRGARRLAEAALGIVPRARTLVVTADELRLRQRTGDPVKASLAVARRLAPVVAQTVAAGRLPVVLAGSCDVSIGVLAGFDHGRCGVVWVDAHGDFNTPESTITGFFPGMSLAVITGHCHQEHWGEVGDNEPIAEAATLLVGVRELDPAERERLERSAIRMAAWQDGTPLADVRSHLADLARYVQEVYLHIDLDGLDPEVAPGIVDPPVPGGLSLAQIDQLIRDAARSFRLRAAALTTYDPDRDPDGRTLRAALHIIRRLAAWVEEDGATAIPQATPSP